MPERLPLRILTSIHPLHHRGEAPEEIARQARAAEAGGVERVLVGYTSPNPDGWIVSSFILAATTDLGVLLAHRPGVMHPVAAARQAATLHYASRGRLALNVVTGGSPADQKREGDGVPHDQRYLRSTEYVEVMRALWEAESPYTHEGDFYSFERALLVLKPWDSTPPEIFMGGASEAAIDFGVSSSDVYMLWGEPLEPTAERIAAIRSREATLGRSVNGFSMSFRLVVGDSSEGAWERADETLAGYEDRSGRVKTHAEDTGRTRQLEMARASTRQDTNFWSGITLATGGQGSTSALVGTAEEIVESLERYRDLGINSFLLTGPDGTWDEDIVPVVDEVRMALA